MIEPEIPRIPGYKNIREWNKGGMGVIYRGEDISTGEQIIIKKMKIAKTPKEKQQFSYQSGLFKSEIEITQSLRHDHILGARDHDYITYEGYDYPYLVFPYIKDGSLDKLMKAEHPWNNLNWSLLEIVDIVVQAAEGLYYLHQQQPAIVHQDIKPENLLWKGAKGDSRRVHIWVSDFGTARWEKSADYETKIIVGTRGNMSPEQANSKIRRTTDQFALALLARHLLTGFPPPRRNKDLSPPQVELSYPTPTMLNPARLHYKEIDTVLLQALSEDPSERFPNVYHFALRLKEVILRQENPALYSTLKQHMPGFYTDTTEPSPTVNHQARNVDRLSPTVPVENRPIQIEKKEVFPDILIAPPYKYHPVDKPMPPVPLALEMNKVAPIPLAHFPLQECFRAKLPDKPTTLAWSHDGQCLLCVFHDDSPLLIYRDGRIEELRGIYGHIACWSPGSRVFGISAYNRSSHEAIIRIWDRANQTRDKVAKEFRSNTPIDGLAWSTRGQLAAWLNSELLLYYVSEQESFPNFPEPPRSISLPNVQCSGIGTLQWSPNGSLLAAGAKNGALFCWDADRQEIQEYIPASKTPIYSLAWFPDSSMLALAFRNKRVTLWSTLRKKELSSWNDLAEMPMMVSISPQDFTVTIATKGHLLFGYLHEQTLSASYPGQSLASWSPLSELATLVDENNSIMLTILQR